MADNATSLVTAMRERVQQGDVAGARKGWELVRDDGTLVFASKMAVLRECADFLQLDVEAEKRVCTEALRRVRADLTGGNNLMMTNDAFQYSGEHGWSNWQTERIGWSFCDLYTDETGEKSGVLFFEKEGHGTAISEHANELSDMMFNGWRRLMVKTVGDNELRKFKAKFTWFKFGGFICICTNEQKNK